MVKRQVAARSKNPSQQDELCRCVDLNGTTVEGTEVVVEGGARRPDCRNGEGGMVGRNKREKGEGGEGGRKGRERGREEG